MSENGSQKEPFAGIVEEMSPTGAPFDELVESRRKLLTGKAYDFIDTDDEMDEIKFVGVEFHFINKDGIRCTSSLHHEDYDPEQYD